jgi:hypothetical protein
MREAVRLGLVLVLGLILSGAAQGDIFPESNYPDFAEEGDFDPGVPSPGSILGHRVGARPFLPGQILRYFQTLAESPRAQLHTYGQTHEGRDLVALLVSSEANMSRIDEIQAEMARLSDPRVANGPERNNLIENLPAVCWMAYTIHGDELSGSDAAVALAYRLVAGEDAEAQEIRENVITIIDPLQNPDGRARFLAQIYAFNGKVPSPDNQSLSHTGFWPWGRGNHYWFDLNRDWFPLVHPESRGRLKLFASWHPQLVVDGHEMGAFDTYLFSPPREPFNPFMTPELMKWWDIFAKDQAEAFDGYGWSYYTREWNEEWYPGYGSTWALYTGAIGILYEQAGTEGSMVKRPDGTVIDYGESVHHQFVSSMANVLTAARNREELLSDYARQRESAIRVGTNGMVKAFLLPPGDDPQRTRRLVETLLLQGIEVHVATTPLTARDLHDHWGESWVSRTLPPGTYVVSLAQPDARVARTIMDFHLQMPDSFLVSEREYLERQKGSRLYEITAWAVTLSYGIPVYWAGQAPQGSLESVTSLPSEEDGRLENPDAEYGFLIDGSTDASVRAVARLLSEGLVVHNGREEFTVDGRSYPRGSFLLRRDANPEGFVDGLEEICKEFGVTARGVSTALVTQGPDLGGGRFRRLLEPRVAMLAATPTNFTSTGSLWYLLDHEMEMRVSLLKTEEVRQADLGKYNVIMVPRAWGGASGYRRYLGESGTAKLRSWVESGGTLIAVGSGASFFADSSAHMSAVRLRRAVVSKYPPPIWGLDLETAKEVGLFQATGVPLQKEGEEAATASIGGLGIPGLGSPVLGPGAVPFAGGGKTAWTPPPEKSVTLTDEEWLKADVRMRRFQPRGAYLRVDMDPDHWLTAAMPSKIPAMARGSYVFMAQDPVRTVARFAAPENLHVAGLLWPETAARMAQTAFMTREGLGRGQVILMAMDPFFRGYHHSTKRLFLNAVVLGPGMGTTQTVPW